ncbi:small, acid-soluble spore protein L [Pseudalkalibacillus caeni]|uniref:Small, acid-soluble spore protein L n=1 Tax=Exobacillus caeni TaxID=2574798 RepID=A0A5R9F0D3_9BACL|nr:small, acid-soluble spore protein L [Pseudalkalibacillus caeni]TLS35870.1 small, acid-soluble spore protein L [Pseudalkalibacillus caeni]
MAEKNESPIHTSVNPQGTSPDKQSDTEPKSRLEQRAKKRNTKI